VTADADAGRGFTQNPLSAYRFFLTIDVSVLRHRLQAAKGKIMFLHLLLLGCIVIACLQMGSFCENVRQLANEPSPKFPTLTLALALLLYLALYFLVPIDERRVNYFEVLLLVSAMFGSMITGALAICLGVYVAFVRLVGAALR